MRPRSRQIAILILAVMLAHMASMTAAPLAMHAAVGQSRVSHAGANHVAPDSSAVGDLATVHDAVTCIATGELATASRLPLPALVGLAALPADMRWEIHPGELRHTVHPEPPPPDAAVRRALLQVFLN